MSRLRRLFQNRELSVTAAQPAPRPPAQSEKGFQEAVLAFARLHDWLCYHTHDSRRSEPGFPDLCMVKNGLLIFAELKVGRNGLSPAQRKWVDRLTDVQTDACVDHQEPVRVYVWYPDDWETIERVLGRGGA